MRKYCGAVKRTFTDKNCMHRIDRQPSYGSRKFGHTPTPLKLSVPRGVLELWSSSPRTTRDFGSPASPASGSTASFSLHQRHSFLSSASLSLSSPSLFLPLSLSQQEKQERDKEKETEKEKSKEIEQAKKHDKVR